MYQSELENKLWDDIQQEYLKQSEEIVNYGSALCDFYDAQNLKKTKNYNFYGTSIKRDSNFLYLLVIQDLSYQFDVKKQFNALSLRKLGTKELNSPSKSTLILKRNKFKKNQSFINNAGINKYLNDYSDIKNQQKPTSHLYLKDKYANAICSQEFEEISVMDL